MANPYIEPTFASEIDRLTFLSRLWGVTLTAQDVLDWEAYKLLRPTTKLPTESHQDFYERFRVWDDGRVARLAFYILSKWDSYRLGKIRAEVATYLSNKINPNRTQAREAVRLCLLDKWADRIVNVNVATDLLTLVQGLVWPP